MYRIQEPHQQRPSPARACRRLTGYTTPSVRAMRSQRRRSTWGLGMRNKDGYINMRILSLHCNEGMVKDTHDDNHPWLAQLHTSCVWVGELCKEYSSIFFSAAKQFLYRATLVVGVKNPSFSECKSKSITMNPRMTYEGETCSVAASQNYCCPFSLANTSPPGQTTTDNRHQVDRIHGLAIKQ